MKLTHIAFIPDGNRRWAKKHNLPVIRGHEKGIDKMGQVLKWCQDEKIKHISFWAFSTENFNRDKNEVEALFKAFENRLKKLFEEADFKKSNTSVRFIGMLDKFPKPVFEGMKKIEQQTKNYSDFHLNLFVGYGGRAELIEGVKKILKEHKNIDPDLIDENFIEKNLWSANIPDPDLIIRTSGEKRISGFLPFKSAYSELYFCKKYWPDFSFEDFQKALNDFKRRVRRWGR
jgi:undecaprenyl diphosphate synthase